MSKIKEKILVYKIKKNKDPKAFDEIYELYTQGVYRHIVLRVPSKEEAEDLRQEVFLKLWDYLISSPRSVENLKALIYKIAQNLIAAYYVKQNLVKTIAEKDKIELEVIEYKIEDKRDNIQHEVNLKMEFSELKITLDKLEPKEYRQVIELKFLEELSYKEISKILNKSVGNVKVLLHRAIKKLQNIMDNIHD